MSLDISAEIKDIRSKVTQAATIAATDHICRAALLMALMDMAGEQIAAVGGKNYQYVEQLLDGASAHMIKSAMKGHMLSKMTDESVPS